MKTSLCAGLLLSLTLALPALADDPPKADEIKVLKRADLKQFEGVWVMDVKTEKGWTGTIRATITLYDAGSAKENFGSILYSYALKKGRDETSVENAPGGGIGFAGVTRGKAMFLVTAKREGFLPKVPFKVDPKAELSAPVTISDDKLTLDVSKSVKHFCFPFDSFDLDWSKLTFTKAKKN
jgi:hypothetical protein